MAVKLLSNPHAGQILKLEFLDVMGMSQNALAHAIKVPSNRIHDIVRGRRSVTADTDIRLCKFFGLSDGYFLRLQIAHDIMQAKRALADKIAKIQPYSMQGAVDVVGRARKS